MVPSVTLGSGGSPSLFLERRPPSNANWLGFGFRVPAKLTAGAADFNNENKNGKPLPTGPMALNGAEHGPHGGESDLKVELRATPTLAHLGHLRPHVDSNTAPAWDDDNAPALPPYNSACTGQDEGFDQTSTPTQQANGNKPVSVRAN